MNLLDVDSIGVSYGTHRVLTSASVRAAAGQITVVVGRNGVGKSTLLRVAVGRLRPEYGRVRLADRDVTGWSLARLARGGLFFLPARELLDPTIVLGAQLRAAGKDGDAVAAELGIGDLLSIRPRLFSGGELRRAEIAMALARRPRCLLADEPFRGISPLDAEVISAALRRLSAAGAAVVVTGHELTMLRSLADRVFWCVAGMTHEFPTAAAAWGDPQFSREFLGSR